MVDKARFHRAKEMRVQNGLTQLEVYTRARVSAATFRKIEDGQECRSDKVVSVFKAICDLTGQKLDVSEYVEFFF